MHIAFAFGQVLSFDNLSNNSVALDGAVQGPQADPTRRRFSFDHHAGCLRLVTLATCQQVAVAIELGLVVDEATTVHINDLDADTVLSVWLLQKAAKGHGDDVVTQPRVRQLIDQVGRTDAHGPIFPFHPLHAALGPSWGDKAPQDLAMLEGFLAVLEAWYTYAEEPKLRPARAGRGYALAAGDARWAAVETADGFGPLYAAGYLAAALVCPAADGSSMWTIGKRSDLVPLNLGPADTSEDRSGAYTAALLGELAKAEAAAGCPAAANWGGASSIGGSPRLPGGVGSRLAEEQVVAILNRFLIG